MHCKCKCLCLYDVAILLPAPPPPKKKTFYLFGDFVEERQTLRSRNSPHGGGTGGLPADRRVNAPHTCVYSCICQGQALPDTAEIELGSGAGRIDYNIVVDRSVGLGP